MLDTHRVSLMSLDMMAAGSSDPAIVEQLRRANRSRQLTLLRAVLDRVRVLGPIMAPAPPLDEAWMLLAEAQRLDEAAVDQVITHPRTGLWAAKALRRLASEKADDGDPPLWAELGFLHQLATAAAIRARHRFRSRVPVWRGLVMLPTLGLADVKSRREWEFAHVHGEGDHVLIRGPAGSVQLPVDFAVDGAGWLALRTLHAGELKLCLDDLDPYRKFDGPLPPHRLSITELSNWADRLRDTWRLLIDYHPNTAAELAVGLTTLVPHAAVDNFQPFSASHNDAFGSVVLSLPSNPVTFAATLVHELQHSKFGVLLSLLDLLEPVDDNDIPRLYAPWRDDPRPASGVLHGVYSFLGVTAFYREHSAAVPKELARPVQFEFAYRREQTVHAVETLLAESATSALGYRFLTTTRDRLRAWSFEPLPDDVRAAAHRANVDHRLAWRLRHCQPEAAVVGQLAEAWLRHRRKPVIAPDMTQLRPAVGSLAHSRLALARIWVTEPELYAVYRAEPELAIAQIDGATEADLVLIDGDTGEATELYRQQILRRADSTAAWTGLALASKIEALLNRPELVIAVHQEIRRQAGVIADPVRIAVWLS
jgi:HEXXH motif-containing protein